MEITRKRVCCLYVANILAVLVHEALCCIRVTTMPTFRFFEMETWTQI
jgi:hypothetical protein